MHIKRNAEHQKDVIKNCGSKALEVVRESGGRFLEKVNEHWMDVGDKRASNKIRLSLLQLGKNNNEMSSLELTVAGDREVIDAIKAKDIVTT